MYFECIESVEGGSPTFTDNLNRDGVGGGSPTLADNLDPGGDGSSIMHEQTCLGVLKPLL